MRMSRLIAGTALAAAIALAGCAPKGDAPPAAGNAAARPGGPNSGAEPPSPETPDSAKALGVKYTDLEGRQFTLSELPGRVKVVNYWATWCKPCIKELPSFNKLHAEYGPKGVTFVGVSIDEEGAEKVKPFLETPNGKIDYKVALARLSDLEPVGVTEAIPVTLVYDASGRLVKRFDGYADEGELESAVTTALGTPAG